MKLSTNKTVRLLAAGPLFYLSLVLLSLLDIAGCGSGSDRRAINGSISFAGQPVDRGQIQFAPVSTELGSASGAVIIDGAYEIPVEQGLLPGEYQVRIYWPEPAPPELKADQAPPKERIPAKYNVTTELSIEVKRDGANKFDFHLDE